MRKHIPLSLLSLGAVVALLAVVEHCLGEKSPADIDTYKRVHQKILRRIINGKAKAALGEIVGDVVGFFLHDDVVLSGANATYTITEMRFGRVMDIRLTGAPAQRGLFIQPVSYAGSGVRIDHNAPSTGGLLGRLILAR